MSCIFHRRSSTIAVGSPRTLQESLSNILSSTSARPLAAAGAFYNTRFSPASSSSQGRRMTTNFDRKGWDGNPERAKTTPGQEPRERPKAKSDTESRVRASSEPPPPVVLREEDIVESFVRGSGPGGQKINKTASCVQLKHIPTGTIVRCQATRSQSRNREIAREILRDKLDEALRGEFSRAAMEASRERSRKARRRRKTIKKHFKSRRDRAMMMD